MLLIKIHITLTSKAALCKKKFRIFVLHLKITSICASTVIASLVKTKEIHY
jgi:hypothetical protein